jgi:hypothetical protein
MHSFHYTKAKDYEGKKVVVVGACTSGKPLSICAGCAFHHQVIGHDISKDLADHGVGTFLVTICCLLAPGT